MISAEDILTAKVFEQSVDSIQMDLWEKFQHVHSDDVEKLRVISLQSWAVKEFVGELERRMRSGAESRINQRKV